MSAMRWTPALSVGDPGIDEQHAELFRRAERIAVALREGAGPDLGALVGYFIDYLFSHFEAEHRLMRESGYPGIEPHVRAHARLGEQLSMLLAELVRNDGAPDGPTIQDWIQTWLDEHVAGMDQELGRWLGKRGPSDWTS